MRTGSGRGRPTFSQGFALQCVLGIQGAATAAETVGEPRPAAPCRVVVMAVPAWAAAAVRTSAS